MTRRIAVAAFLAAVLLGVATAARPGLAGTAVRGDANCDGVMDARDVELILQLDLGLIDALPCSDAADVDYNSTLNAIDASYLLQQIAGLQGSLPALLRVEMEPASVEVGQELVANVRIENVEGLAGFELTLLFNHDVVSLQRVEDASAFLGQGSRKGTCNEPATGRPDRVTVVCTTAGAPVCLGGAHGASGDGVLARIVFRAERAGTARFYLEPAKLFSDDRRPCDAARAQGIRSKRLAADAEITAEP